MNGENKLVNPQQPFSNYVDNAEISNIFDRQCHNFQRKLSNHDSKDNDSLVTSQSGVSIFTPNTCIDTTTCKIESGLGDSQSIRN